MSLECPRPFNEIQEEEKGVMVEGYTSPVQAIVVDHSSGAYIVTDANELSTVTWLSQDIPDYDDDIEVLYEDIENKSDQNQTTAELASDSESDVTIECEILNEITNQKEDDLVKSNKKGDVKSKEQKESKEPTKNIVRDENNHEIPKKKNIRLTKGSDLCILPNGRFVCVLCRDMNQTRTYKNKNTLYNHRSMYHRSDQENTSSGDISITK